MSIRNTLIKIGEDYEKSSKVIFHVLLNFVVIIMLLKIIDRYVNDEFVKLGIVIVLLIYLLRWLIWMSKPIIESKFGLWKIIEEEKKLKGGKVK